MNNTTATINGLMEGISILETNKNEQPYLPSDIIYNEQETGYMEECVDDGFIFPVTDYQTMYMNCVYLLSIPEEKFELN